MPFLAREILFSPTTACNLNCPHCDIKRSRKVLSKAAAQRFLSDCERSGIRKIGYTGGEPFLEPDLICSLARKTVKKRMLFGRLMTNGVWYNNRRQLEASLTKLYRAGYDGEICVSVDAFHRQDIRKVARFIKAVLSTWERQDLVSIACVTGLRETGTEKKLKTLSRLLGGRLIGFGQNHPCIRGGSLFIKILKIDLSPVGKAARLKNGWDGTWFKEDHCKGPGDAFFILPNGSVKPCCGYAADSEALTIGNINRNSVKELMENARTNPFVDAVFRVGLTTIRKRLKRMGVAFPGKTSNNCFFCNYVLTEVPRHLYERSLAWKPN